MKHDLEHLSAYANEEQQEEIINEILSDETFHLGFLIQPIGRKDMWDNCASILSRTEPMKLMKYTRFLLEWLQDLNWPGAMQIMEKLCEIDHEYLSGRIRAAKAEANQTDDEIWIENLEMLENQLESKQKAVDRSQMV